MDHQAYGETRNSLELVKDNILANSSFPTYSLDDNTMELALTVALANSDIDDLELLFEYCSPEIRSESVVVVQMIAQKKYDLLEMLIKNGFSPTSSAVDLAIKNRDLKGLEILIEAGGEVENPNITFSNCLRDKDYRMCNYIIKNAAGTRFTQKKLIHLVVLNPEDPVYELIYGSDEMDEKFLRLSIEMSIKHSANRALEDLVKLLSPDGIRKTSSVHVNDDDYVDLEWLVDEDEADFQLSSRDEYKTKLSFKALGDGKIKAARILINSGVDISKHGQKIVELVSENPDLEGLIMLEEVGIKLELYESYMVEKYALGGSPETLRHIFDRVKCDKDNLSKTLEKLTNESELIESSGEKVRVLIEGGASSSSVAKSFIAKLIITGDAESLLFLLGKEISFPSSHEVKAYEDMMIANSNRVQNEIARLAQNELQRLRDRFFRRMEIEPADDILHQFEDDRKTNYSNLIKEILYYGDQEHPINLMRLLCCRENMRLKSDAFSSNLPWHSKPFVQVSLYAAYVASVLCPNSVEDLKEQFITLIKQDVKRVENTKGLSWKKYASSLDKHFSRFSDFSDVIREVSEVILLPLIAIKEEKSFSNSPLRSIIEVHKREALLLAQKLIGQEKATLDFATLNSKWHQGRNSIPANLRPLRMIGSWSMLFEPVECQNGVHIHALSTAKELIEEGESMDHCVGDGGYTSACEEGRSHILSVRKGSKHLATIEIDRVRQDGDFKTPDGMQWKQIQFRGYDNGYVGNTAKQAYKDFLEQASRGGVVFFPKLDKVERKKLATRNPISKVCGYELIKIKEIIPVIVEHYNTRICINRNNGTSIPLLGTQAVENIESKLSEIDYLEAQG